MKKIILALALIGLVGCKRNVKSTPDKTDLLIAKSDSIAAQSENSTKHLDSVATVTVKKANNNFEKLIQQVEVYKKEITKVKSLQKVQTEKVIYIHDTVFIVEKKNIFGRTKKTEVTKSAADSTINEDINITNSTDSTTN